MFDIITDSACDLTPETAATLNIEIIPFYVSLDGEHYRKGGQGDRRARFLSVHGR